MQVEVKLPNDLEEGGSVLDVFVSVGDEIEVEQGLIEIETDKATVEVPSSHAGKIVELKVQEGDSLAAGDTIVLLETTSAAPTRDSSTSPRVETPSAPPPDPVPEKLSPPSPAHVVPEATPPEAPKAEPAPTPSASVPTTPAPPVTSPGTSPGVPSHLAPAGPAVRRFAREVGVDLQAVQGTGPGGRITREDVLAIVRQTNSQASASKSDDQASPSSGSAPASDTSAVTGEHDKWGPVRIEKMAKIRKTIASKMHESWSTVPRVTNFDDADVTELEAMRQASKADYAESGIKLTTMPFIIKACALALRSNPLLNAAIDMEQEQVIYKQYVNVGIAVDTERGLVVPSLRQADQLSIPGIARALGDIAKSARSRKFSVDDLRGSTFTISNLGAIGGDVFHAHHQHARGRDSAHRTVKKDAGSCRRRPDGSPHDAAQPILRSSISGWRCRCTFPERRH